MKDKKRSCEYCDNFQVFYIKNQGKFLKTDYGYCCIKNSTCIYHNYCGDWTITTEQEKFYPLTVENVSHVVLYLNKLIEKIGLTVDEKHIGKCEHFTDSTPYNSKLK